MSVFEVGCGAGALLHGFYELGCRVGGLDLSDSLIELARQVMPEGDFRVGDAATFTATETADVVIAGGVFIYFQSQTYARRVLQAMTGAARHAVLVLDLPDRATELKARTTRIAALGGPDEYAKQYEGLEHQYYDREEMRAFLAASGCASVDTDNVRIPGYANAAFRFDLWGFKGSTPW